MKYKLAEGVKAQALAVNVLERRPGLSYAVTVRQDVIVRPGEVVETEHDLSAWVKAGLVVEVFDAAAQFKAALPVPAPTPILEPPPMPTPEAAPSEEMGSPSEEGDAPSEEGDVPSEGGDAAPLAKAAVRAVRRRG
jgi:hypothetical protein